MRAVTALGIRWHARSKAVELWDMNDEYLIMQPLQVSKLFNYAYENHTNY